MRPQLHLTLYDDEAGRFFGHGPYRLLLAVRQTGSLRAAAGEMGMSYSKALRLIDRAERVLGLPLTQRNIGGKGGGGSRLTPGADRLLELYERWQDDCETYATDSFTRTFSEFLQKEEEKK